jgi:integrase
MVRRSTAIAELRNRHRAANTISNALAALSVCHHFLDERHIDLPGRLAECKLLELGEIEDLVRAACRIDLPKELTPHVLRHTWNDLFSAEMEGRKVDQENEKKIRSYQMGWKPTSATAAA